MRCAVKVLLNEIEYAVECHRGRLETQVQMKGDFWQRLSFIGGLGRILRKACWHRFETNISWLVCNILLQELGRQPATNDNVLYGAIHSVVTAIGCYANGDHSHPIVAQLGNGKCRFALQRLAPR